MVSPQIANYLHSVGMWARAQTFPLCEGSGSETSHDRACSLMWKPYDLFTDILLVPLDFAAITHSLVGFTPKAKDIRFDCVCSNYITLCLFRGAASLYITCLSVAVFFFSGPWSSPPQDQISSKNTSLQYVQLQELANDDVVRLTATLPTYLIQEFCSYSQSPHTPTTAIERGVATSLVKCILAELPEATVNRRPGSISLLSKFGCKFDISQSHEKVFMGNPPEESVVS